MPPELHSILTLPRGSVGRRGQTEQRMEKCVALAFEKPCVRKEMGSGSRARQSNGGWTNYRA